jgi:hypothetical protein
MKAFKIIGIICLSLLVLFWTIFIGSAMICGILEGLGIINSPGITEETIEEETIIAETTIEETVIEEEKTLFRAPVEFTVIEYNQDYLGGNTIRVSIKNLTNKKIKWVEYTLAFFNIKGELLSDDIRGWITMSWYDGPISPGDRIEINGGTFYNSHFQGDYLVDKILIHYEDDTEELINQSNLNTYENIIFNSQDNMVWTSESAASYHTENCEYRYRNACNIQLTIKEAKEKGKARCSFCWPY